jgi:hypothetical protein
MVHSSKCKRKNIDKAHILGFGLEIPDERFDIRKELYCFKGWIVGARDKINKVEVFINGLHSLSLPVVEPRKDIAKRFPGNPAGEIIGFDVPFNQALLPNNFEISFYTDTAFKRGIHLARLSGENPFRFTFSPAMKPVFLTSLGRSGSTIVLAAIASHPEVVAFQPFDVEARYSLYWLQLALTLCAPKGWISPMITGDFQDPAWVFGDNVDPNMSHQFLPKLPAWFFDGYPKRSFEFCMESLEKHYRELSEVSGKTSAVYFCEKMPAHLETLRLLDLIPSGKEVILVRDFRDVLCSILEFNKKRGYAAFGRESFPSDEQYVKESLAYMAHQIYKCWKLREETSFLLKYEYFMTQPDQALKQLFQYLEIDDSRVAVDYVRKQMESISPKRQKFHKTSKSAEDSIQRYRKRLPPELIDVCNLSFREPLKGMGYEIGC